MDFLLDTHGLLWTVDAPEKLSSKTMALLDDRENRIYVSIATPWELAIKANTGRLDVAELLRGFEQRLLAAGYSLVETTAAHVIRAGLLPLHHRDPFDRLLVAQALDLRVPIISRDDKFDLYGVRRIWD
jgi:PIN domain nuclease of toxin-antitoxin system